MSFHFCRMRACLFSTPFRFESCIFARSARRHAVSFSLLSLHMPAAFHMKPFAWHSSSAIITSWHPVLGALLGGDAMRYVAYLKKGNCSPTLSLVYRWGCIVMGSSCRLWVDLSEKFLRGRSRTMLQEHGNARKALTTFHSLSSLSLTVDWRMVFPRRGYLPLQLRRRQIHHPPLRQSTSSEPVQQPWPRKQHQPRGSKVRTRRQYCENPF